MEQLATLIEMRIEAIAEEVEALAAVAEEMPPEYRVSLKRRLSRIELYPQNRLKAHRL